MVTNILHVILHLSGARSIRKAGQAVVKKQIARRVSGASSEGMRAPTFEFSSPSLTRTMFHASPTIPHSTTKFHRFRWKKHRTKVRIEHLGSNACHVTFGFKVPSGSSDLQAPTPLSQGGAWQRRQRLGQFSSMGFTRKTNRVALPEGCVLKT